MKKIGPQSVVLSGFRCLLLPFIIAALPACVSTNMAILGSLDSPHLVCETASDYQGQTIGDGHCVNLIKRCSAAPQTKQWRPGERVLDASLTPGTVIATFKNGRYPNESGYHTAIYIKQDRLGIWVWDQWVGKPVHKRLIRIRDDGANPGNTAQAYKVVNIDKFD